MAALLDLIGPNARVADAAAIADLVFVEIPYPCDFPILLFFCRSLRRCNAIFTLPKQTF